MTAADDPKTSNPGGRFPGIDPTADEGRREAPDEAVERLNRELADKTAEAARNWDLYLRERADTENFKKRMQRDKAEALRFANEGLVRDLLPVIDNLERAVDHADLGGNGQPLIEGVRLVLQNALEVLQRHGVGRIDATGAAFDPSRHEAVVQVPDGRREPNRVVEQYEPGYTLHDRLIRPAKVSVSSKPSVERPSDDD
jgi:molecular chaperone GrpE